MVDRAHLDVSDDDLTRLAGDLDAMQRHLDNQVRRMDAVVDGIEAGWKGEAAKGYRALHPGAAEDAVRIRELLKLLESAMRMSRDGFTDQELDTLRRMRQAESRVDVAREAADLSRGTAAPTPASRILDV
ncbi:WXG100 family type VII secretion target [Streptomyces xantholiticus]|uniref:WXG100 family type VII secretion target n=1 Tax=Streptomyces xantholiticus TaxID=68285 RepID=A0ABV1UR36_9ACTN